MFAHTSTYSDMPSSNAIYELESKFNQHWGGMCGNVKIEHITEGTMASGVTEVLVAENCNLPGDDGTTFPGIFLHFVKDSTVVDVFKHQINTSDLANQKADASMAQSSTGSHISSSMTFKEGQGYVVMPESVMSVLRIFPFTDKSGLNMFDMRYQLRLHDLYDLSSTSILQYEMVQNHVQLLDELLVGEVPVRFNKVQNRLYLFDNCD